MQQADFDKIQGIVSDELKTLEGHVHSFREEVRAELDALKADLAKVAKGKVA